MATMAEILCAVAGLMCSEGGQPPHLPPASDLPQEYFELPEKPEKAAPPPPPPPKSAELSAPDRIDFGLVELDGEKFRDVTLQNSGGQPIEMQYVELSGSASFASSGACPEMGPGQTCTMKLIFSPDVGGMAVGTVIIGWNGNITRIGLSGEGKAAPPPPVVRRAPPPKPAPPDPRVDDAERSLAFALGQPVKVPNAAVAGVTLGDSALGDNPLWAISEPTYRGDKTPGRFAGDVSTFPIERCRTMKRDFFIPLVLSQTLNTQIAGPINAHVDRDVFSVDGRLVLIPKGTKFIGKFEPLSKQGDTRVSAEWEEIIRPDGASIVLQKTAAADAMGRSGLTGVVDNRFFEKYGTVIAATAISAAVAYATQGDTSDDGTTSDGTFTAAGQALNQSLGQVTAEALRNAANLAPRVTVAKGTLVHSIPGRQWYFPNAYRIVELNGPAPKLTFECSGDFFRDLRGIAQNPIEETQR